MELAEAIIKLLNAVGFNIVWSLTGKVISVDENKRTCNVELTNKDADLKDVRLQATEGGDTGIIFYPAENSNVIVHFLNRDNAYVTKTDKVSKIELITESGEILLNGDEFGGLIKTDELKTQLAKNTQRIDTIISVLKSTITSVALHPNPGWSAIINPILNALQKEDYSNIENETVKHG